MKTLNDINIVEWFCERELTFVPDHFVVTNAPVTPESKQWILEKLTGRYSFSTKPGTYGSVLPAFEDPKEASFYELRWG